MAITSSVSVDSISPEYMLYKNVIVSAVGAAASRWGDFLIGDTNLQISVHLQPIPDTPDYDVLAHASSVDYVFLGYLGDTPIWTAGAGYKIFTGHHSNGPAPDLEIYVDSNDLGGMFFGQPSALLEGGIPADMTDAYSLFLHEIGHALGFFGWRDQVSGKPRQEYASPYDTLVTMSGDQPFFTGTNAESVYGGPVPLTYKSLVHYGNDETNGHPGASLVNNNIMNIFIRPGTRYDINDIDVAILSDTGLATRFSDYVYGSEAHDSVNGGAGNDTISSSEGDDSLSGSTGDELISACERRPRHSWRG